MDDRRRIAAIAEACRILSHQIAAAHADGLCFQVVATPPTPATPCEVTLYRAARLYVGPGAPADEEITATTVTTEPPCG